MAKLMLIIGVVAALCLLLALRPAASGAYYNDRHVSTVTVRVCVPNNVNSNDCHTK